MMYLTRSGARPLSLLALAALLAACGGNDDGNGYSAEIRRTEMGVPHIKASNWSGVGFFGSVHLSIKTVSHLLL